ncbi:cytochrome P450 [Lentzea sp. NPDC005914]|uniref:cytochrome P450 n=1 Tax=Lentzea sp. NPDC005914 TaxID=3154572 RepID=UPI0033E72612
MITSLLRWMWRPSRWNAPETGAWPPGPRLPAALQTIMWVVAPMRFGSACLRRYGPVFTARIVGFGRVVHVCTPDGIRRILRDDAGSFDAAAANKAIGFVVGDHSLLMAHGVTHTERRRILMRPLHGANVATYVELMESVVEQEIRRWVAGTRVELLDCFQRVTLEVMMRAVFGITDSVRLARLRVLVPKLLDVNPLLILLPAMRTKIGPGARFQKLLAEVDEIVFAEIAERRAAPKRGGDVLSLLADQPCTDQELRDHLVTLLAVGQETTATQLAWFFERVLRTPDALKRVTAAVEEGDGKLLDAAIHESIRVRPSTLDLGRVGRRTWRLDDYEFPPGTMFAVSLGLLHHSAALHPNPGEYSLDRFYPVEPPSAHFLPFGGGSHRCLGASLAMVEMRTVISTVLRTVRLEPADPAPERLAPKGPMLVPGRGAAVVVTEVLPS